MNDENKLKEKLETLAKQECWEDVLDDDTIIDDMAGGNEDDAYYGGLNSGEILLARRLLSEFFGIEMKYEDRS